MIVHPHSSPATCRWQRCVVVFSRRFYSKVDFPPVGISSCHQMTSEHLLFAITNTFALSYLDQACSWIVYVTSGCCRKHLKSIESICADILSGFHHYFPKIYCSLRHFFAETLDWCIYRPMIYFNECPQSHRWIVTITELSLRYLGKAEICNAKYEGFFYNCSTVK